MMLNRLLNAARRQIVWCSAYGTAYAKSILEEEQYMIDHRQEDVSPDMREYIADESKRIADEAVERMEA